MARHLEETDIPIEYKGMKYNVSPSALRSNNLTVELPEVKVLGKRKNKGYKSAFNPNGAGEVVATMMNSPLQLADYAFNRFIDAGKGEHGKTNYKYTPVQTTMQRVGETFSPTRHIGAAKGTIRSLINGKPTLLTPWSENNPGLTGNPYFDLAIDLGIGGLGIKGTKYFNKTNKNKPIPVETWTPEQWTTFQDKAIAEGDMVRAQMLRDLHYKVKTPNNQITTNEGYPAKLLHGTPTKGWHIYDYNKFGTTTDNGMYGKGMYLTGDKDYAGVYAFDAGRTNGEIKQLYAYSKQPFYIRNKENMLPKEKADRVNAAFQFNRSHQYTDDIPQHILDELNRSDAIVEKSIKPVKFNDRYIVNKSYPYGPFNYDEVVIPNTSNVKYADAVTYDKNGVRIPLGERDNFKINDFRYSLLPFGIGLNSLLNNN